MNNKMVLGILSVYAVILCGVLCFQVIQSRGNVTAPSNSEEVVVEDRLDSAVVIYENSPVMLVNKEQMLIDKNDPSMVPVAANQSIYVPMSFFRSAYNAAASEDLSSSRATIRLDNQALVLDRQKADLVDSAGEADIEYNKKVFLKNGGIYVPVEVFADAFGKSVYYYDNMAIISDLKDAFTDTESVDFINSLKSQVNDLPYVANEENMKEITGISTPNNILKQIGSSDEPDGIPTAQLLENKELNTVHSADGYIYYADKNKVYILDPSSGLAVTSTIELDNGFVGRKIYVHGPTLVITGDKEAENKDGADGFSRSTIAYVYNISNKTAPSKLRELETEGSYINSVQNGSYVYLLSSIPATELSADGKYYPPSYRDSLSGNEPVSLEYSRMQYFPEGGGRDYTTIASLNIEDSSMPAELKTYLCAGENVYMSSGNIYVAKDRYNAFDSNENTENTVIYRLSLSNGKVYSSGKGNVKGYITNKDSMNEYSGYFRLAAHYRKKGANTDITNVYVLNNNLEICGYANEIVSGTVIDRAIFSQNMLFLTPEKTGQAIYSVDMTEPTNPKGNGVLRLTDGNILIYTYDENHILTVDNGGDKLTMSVYDISDKDNPAMLYREELGKGNIESGLFKDISSFCFDKEKNTFTLPVTIYKDESKQEVTFTGGYVYSVDLDDGFQRKGVITLGGNEVKVHPFKYNGLIYNFVDNSALAVDYDDTENITEYVFN